jgi:hypothetical protein
MSFLSQFIDERYLAHRERATSIGGTAAAVLAICLFAWRFYFDHIWSWDLLAVGLTAAVVKIAVMVWSGLRN